ncbi:metalloregulator ArsR/SmtB family transcription factor [Virgibacillus sp. C22-A2]|uniref:Metalloregulator ArsR/SmtB family transcription factor n=1 Tax=Virgibacillus tibetensis TaxID=3042313 RepID=A0ABU6KH68_9BACI|nr:metalloregulator ArsR/SmtB family transcription factor [Virgibacillus sp. C22-A2]
MLKTEITLEEMVPILKLLGDRTRLTIFSLLRTKQACVCELVEALEMSQPSISQHLRKLRDAKLVKEERRGQWIYYSINEETTHYLLVEHVLKFVPDQPDLIEKMKQAKGC